MLFDLRGRGRRRTIQIIYLGLAVLMGGGLVLFGIGGGTSGGFLDYFRNGGGGTSTSKALERRVETFKKTTVARPKDPTTWANLTRAQYNLASAQSSVDQNGSRTLTKDARASMAAAGRSWDTYLALQPKKPDDRVASLMIDGFIGLNQLPKAVAAAQVVAEARPKSAGAFRTLAEVSYAAGNTRIGDLAAKKALALTPKDFRASLKQNLDQAKQLGTSRVQQSKSGG